MLLVCLLIWLANPLRNTHLMAETERVRYLKVNKSQKKIISATSTKKIKKKKAN